MVPLQPGFHHVSYTNLGWALPNDGGLGFPSLRNETAFVGRRAKWQTETQGQGEGPRKVLPGRRWLDPRVLGTPWEL